MHSPSPLLLRWLAAGTVLLTTTILSVPAQGAPPSLSAWQRDPVVSTIDSATGPVPVITGLEGRARCVASVVTDTDHVIDAVTVRGCDEPIAAAVEEAVSQWTVHDAGDAFAGIRLYGEVILRLNGSDAVAVSWRDLDRPTRRTLPVVPSYVALPIDEATCHADVLVGADGRARDYGVHGCSTALAATVTEVIPSWRWRAVRVNGERRPHVVRRDFIIDAKGRVTDRAPRTVRVTDAAVSDGSSAASDPDEARQ